MVLRSILTWPKTNSGTCTDLELEDKYEIHNWEKICENSKNNVITRKLQESSCIVISWNQLTYSAVYSSSQNAYAFVPIHIHQGVEGNTLESYFTCSIWIIAIHTPFNFSNGINFSSVGKVWVNYLSHTASLCS